MNLLISGEVENVDESKKIFGDIALALTSEEHDYREAVIVNETYNLDFSKLTDVDYIEIRAYYDETIGLVTKGDPAPVTVNVNALGALPVNEVFRMRASSPITSCQINSTQTEKIRIKSFISSKT